MIKWNCSFFYGVQVGENEKNYQVSVLTQGLVKTYYKINMEGNVEGENE